jgi:hypothetical protein
LPPITAAGQPDTTRQQLGDRIVAKDGEPVYAID